MLYREIWHTCVCTLFVSLFLDSLFLRPGWRRGGRRTGFLFSYRKHPQNGPKGGSGGLYAPCGWEGRRCGSRRFPWDGFGGVSADGRCRGGASWGQGGLQGRPVTPPPPRRSGSTVGGDCPGSTHRGLCRTTRPRTRRAGTLRRKDVDRRVRRAAVTGVRVCRFVGGRVRRVGLKGGRVRRIEFTDGRAWQVRGWKDAVGPDSRVGGHGGPGLTSGRGWKGRSTIYFYNAHDNRKSIHWTSGTPTG